MFRCQTHIFFFYSWNIQYKLFPVFWSTFQPLSGNSSFLNRKSCKIRYRLLQLCCFILYYQHKTTLSVNTSTMWAPNEDSALSWNTTLYRIINQTLSIYPSCGQKWQQVHYKHNAISFQIWGYDVKWKNFCCNMQWGIFNFKPN